MPPQTLNEMQKLVGCVTFLGRFISKLGEHALPFFKLIPELKFCFGLTDVLDHNRPDLADEPDKMKYTQSLTKAVSQMVVLTFYFE